MPISTPNLGIEERYKLAGTIAAAWFARMEDALHCARTAEQRQLENEILDGALMDAGIIEPELPVERATVVDRLADWSTFED